jgi:hypothetical protein
MEQTKIVATRHSGQHRVGQHETDPDKVDEVMSGAMRKRYVRAAVHPGDVPFVPTINPDAEAAVDAAPAAGDAAEHADHA